MSAPELTNAEWGEVLYALRTLLHKTERDVAVMRRKFGDDAVRNGNKERRLKVLADAIGKVSGRKA